MKRTTLILLTAVLALSLSACNGEGSDSSGTDTTPATAAPTAPGETTAATEPDRTAPDFTVLDGEGNEVSLSELRGKPVVINFWATWCGPCKSELPDFEKAYQSYGEQIHFMMVDLVGGQETVEGAKAFVADQGYTFPVYFDTESSAAVAYGVSAIPMTIFVNADGERVTYATGAIDAALLEKGIGMILPD